METEASEFKYVSGDVAFLKQSFNSSSRVSQSKSSPAKNYRHSFSPSLKGCLKPVNFIIIVLTFLNLAESNRSHVNRRGSTSDSLLNFSNRSGLNKTSEGKCKFFLIFINLNKNLTDFINKILMP